MASAAQGHHCPFLNRADRRCSTHFSLDHLGDAFHDCFDAYKGCRVYLELLVERRVRRAQAAVMAVGGRPGAGEGTNPSWPAPADLHEHAHGHAPTPYVQLTVAHRHA